MAKKKKGARIKVGMACSVCKSQGYVTQRNKVNTVEKLELKKFCQVCNAGTLHKEMKKLH